MASPYVKEPYISSVHEVNAGRLHREFALHFQILDCWDQIVYILLTQEGISLKMLHEGIRGGGGSIGPLPSTFDTIHPID